MELTDKMLAGDELALSRLITRVETDSADVPEIMKQVYPRTGKAHCIGITGPPGAGKSTLVDKLTTIARGKGLSVGIIAVDPTSPFSGGAVLGDRIRMQQHYLDSGVFIRSMATRGSMGGLPTTARGVIKLLDAFGKDLVLVETVGVGQTEIDIMEAADTTIVVLSPEAGDTIQTMKAGLMEIADIFVVNKADRPGAEQLASDINSMLTLNSKNSYWHVPVLTAQAHQGTGIDVLFDMAFKHRSVLESTGQIAVRRREHRKKELLQVIQQKLDRWLRDLVDKDGQLSQFSEKVVKGEIDPYSAATEFLEQHVAIKSYLSEHTHDSQER